MIYKSNFGGQWHKVNPDYKHFDTELNSVRREAFSTGVFRVDKDDGDYHLFVKDWPIGCWFPGDSERARLIISAAFSTYYALTRCK